MKKIFTAAAIILSAMFMWNAGENTARRDLTKHHQLAYKYIYDSHYSEYTTIEYWENGIPKIQSVSHERPILAVLDY